MNINIPFSPISERIEELEYYVGNTPLFPLKSYWKGDSVKIYAKLEWQQFGGSVKARPAYWIIRDAVRKGLLNQSNELLDASSGNTAIAYAIFCAISGIKFTVCLPENASKERKQILKSLNARIIQTDPLSGTDGAQKVAAQMAKDHPEKYFYADQYSNENNWKSHYYTTGEEIWEETAGQITHFVSGLGTTGTFTGTGKRLKEFNKDISLVSLHPSTALHGLEGWKHLETAKVPAIYDSSMADQAIDVDTLTAYQTMKDVAAKEGLLISPSSAANLAGAVLLADTIDEGIIVTVFPDDSSKYGEVLKQIENS